MIIKIYLNALLKILKIIKINSKYKVKDVNFVSLEIELIIFYNPEIFIGSKSESG